MTKKGEELWLMLIIYIRSKRNDLVNLIYYVPDMIEKCFIYYLLFYLFITVSKYSKASSKTKKSVNDWRN